MTALFYPGKAEAAKAGVHGGLLGLALVCLGYNAIAFALRRESHLARNCVLYGSLAAIEVYQVSKHREGARP